MRIESREAILILSWYELHDFVFTECTVKIPSWTFIVYTANDFHSQDLIALCGIYGLFISIS